LAELRHKLLSLLGKDTVNELTLTVVKNSIRLVQTVRELGVSLHSELAMKTHACKVAKQLRRLWQVKRLIGQEVTAQIVYPLLYFPSWIALLGDP